MIRSGQTEKMLIERAASKVANSATGLVREAQQALIDAHSWKDEVRIDVLMKRPYTAKRCARLLHGVPSPRYWASLPRNMVQMVAKDVVYFFAQDRLIEAVPALACEADLAHWIAHFSSTRFENQLIEALIEHAGIESSIYSNPSLAFRGAGLIAAEIDRHAWFTGQRSMTLANSVSVWRGRRRKEL